MKGKKKGSIREANELHGERKSKTTEGNEKKLQYEKKKQTLKKDQRKRKTEMQP